MEIYQTANILSDLEDLKGSLEYEFGCESSSHYSLCLLIDKIKGKGSINDPIVKSFDKVVEKDKEEVKKLVSAPVEEEKITLEEEEKEDEPSTSERKRNKFNK